MNPEIIRTPEAELDLIEIWIYIGRNSPSVANRIMDDIERTTNLIADFPTMGVAHPELAPDMRSFPAGNYVIYYRPIENGIEVIRVLHHARAVEGLF
jgi:toxin ParE1/3/4